jgi:hypothetical protein
MSRSQKPICRSRAPGALVENLFDREIAGLAHGSLLGEVASRAETIGRLLHTAGVFAQRGFVAATLDEIAEMAGHTKGAIYYNFTDKEALFLALLEQRVEANLQAVANIGEAPSTSSGRLRAEQGGPGSVSVPAPAAPTQPGPSTGVVVPCIGPPGAGRPRAGTGRSSCPAQRLGIVVWLAPGGRSRC